MPTSPHRTIGMVLRALLDGHAASTRYCHGVVACTGRGGPSARLRSGGCNHAGKSWVSVRPGELRRGRLGLGWRWRRWCFDKAAHTSSLVPCALAVKTHTTLQPFTTPLRTLSRPELSEEDDGQSRSRSFSHLRISFFKPLNFFFFFFFFFAPS